jgi:hypothetical protein
MADTTPPGARPRIVRGNDPARRDEVASDLEDFLADVLVRIASER